MNERTLRARMLLGEEAMEKLAGSHVAVFGLGGVGSWCAEALARAGVGRLTLIDQDTVGESNINRQLCALGSTVGMGKASVMAQRALDVNPDIDVKCIEGHYEAADRERFFGGYDYVVDAISDLVSCKVDLIMSCMERGIPIVSALGTGNKKDASLLRIADISKTSGCALARVVRRELRQRGVTHHTVGSARGAGEPEQLEAPPPGRRSVPGSLVVGLGWTAAVPACRHRTDKMNTYGKAPEEALACFGAFVYLGSMIYLQRCAFACPHYGTSAVQNIPPPCPLLAYHFTTMRPDFLYSVRCRRSGISRPPV
ncbi:MAG: tRNA threonylcarbamoyladenosine dehydratase [Oscillospiraceae bacterium]